MIDQRTSRAAGQRRRGRALQLALHGASVLAHPDDHAGDHDHGERADDRLEHLLLALRQLALEHPQGDGDGQADRDGDGDPDPDLAQRVAAALTGQEGRDDADDQCCLEPLAEADHEGGKHGEPFERRPGY